MNRKPILAKTHIQTHQESLTTKLIDPSHWNQWNLLKTKQQPRSATLNSFPIQLNRFTFILSGEGTAYTKRTALDFTFHFQTTHTQSFISHLQGKVHCVPHGKGVTLTTELDYQTQGGVMGAWIDRLLLRPIIQWLTTWNLDRLRLWEEKGIHPLFSLRSSIAHYAALFTLSLLWIYQGLVPKLLNNHPGEAALLQRTELSEEPIRILIGLLGFIEIAFGLLILIVHRKRWIHALNILFLLFLAGAAAFLNPGIFGSTYTPITLTWAMVTISLIDAIALHDIPQASNSLRER